MKILCIALLALSGLTVNAVPTCSDFQIEQTCKRFQPDEPQQPGFPKTEEELDTMCKATLHETDCLIKEYEKCSDTFNGKLIDKYRGERELLGYICTKGSEYRTKFLKSAKCLETHLEDFGETCKDIISLEGPECETYFSITGCVYSQMYQKCGKDASDVMQVVRKEGNRTMRKQCFKDDNEEITSFRSFPVSFSF